MSDHAIPTDWDPQRDGLRSPEAAAYVGVKPRTWSSYVHRDQAPAPDGYIDGRTPVWAEETLRAWKASRPGKPGRPRKAR